METILPSDKNWRMYSKRSKGVVDDTILLEEEAIIKGSSSYIPAVLQVKWASAFAPFEQADHQAICRTTHQQQNSSPFLSHSTSQ